jgi:hypothetical protein
MSQKTYFRYFSFFIKTIGYSDHFQIYYRYDISFSEYINVNITDICDLLRLNQQLIITKKALYITTETPYKLENMVSKYLFDSRI